MAVLKEQASTPGKIADGISILPLFTIVLHLKVSLTYVPLTDPQQYVLNL